MMWDDERDIRLLRPVNTPDVRNVIELMCRECEKWNDKWMTILLKQYLK